MRTLVTGATGYIGTRLIPELLDRGHDVRAGHRRTPPALGWRDDVDWVPLDVADAESVRDAVAGVDAVYYLVHGLGGRDFRSRDLAAARTMAAACEEAGVERIVYLTGIVPQVPRSRLSRHIVSRLEVEEALAATSVPSLALRAAIVIGAGSTSFEIVRQVSEALPVQPIPTWMTSRVQPIAVADAVALLADALDGDPWEGALDIGGPETVTYPELLRLYAAVAGLRRMQVETDLLPEPLVALASRFVTRVPAGVVAALVESLQHDMVVTPAEGEDLLGGRRLVGLTEAIRRSLADRPEDGAERGADPQLPSVADPAWAGGAVVLDDEGIPVHRPSSPASRLALGLPEAGVR